MYMGNAWVKVLRQDALTEQDGRCKYCKAPLPLRQATADHKWPRSKRGKVERDNIVAACRPCNEAKADLSHIEFYRLIDRRMPKDASDKILLIWASRRIWNRTHRACERIERMAR